MNPIQPKQLFRICLCCGLFCLQIMFGLLSNADADDTIVTVEDLMIVTSDGRNLKFTIEIATTMDERRKGLMFRQSLAPQSGMLFDYGKTRKVTMWMKNTYVPLDILFIDETGVIGSIAHNTVPLSLVPIPSDGIVLGVLEINAGTAETFNINTGDMVIHHIFKNTVN